MDYDKTVHHFQEIVCHESAVDELGAHLEAEGLTIAGSMYNRYLVGPAQTDDSAQYVTEVCIPVS